MYYGKFLFVTRLCCTLYFHFCRSWKILTKWKIFNNLSSGKFTLYFINVYKHNGCGQWESHIVFVCHISNTIWFRSKWREKKRILLIHKRCIYYRTIAGFLFKRINNLLVWNKIDSSLFSNHLKYFR